MIKKSFLNRIKACQWD